MISFNVSGINEAKRALEKEIKKLTTNKAVLVGIHEGEGTTDNGDLTMAQLGATLHFGTDIAGKNNSVTIPARPWLDVGVKSGASDYIEVIQNYSDDLDNALEIIGQIAVGKVQMYMTDLSTPANADITVSKKGSSNPLIDTGALRQSVTYTISPDMPKEDLG